MISRREFLVGSFAVGGLGAATTQLPKPVERPFVDPIFHGAVGDGRADDIEPIRKALSQAFKLGLPVDGGDKIFAVAGDIATVDAAKPWIRSLRLKQLIPQMNGKTLHFKDCQAIRIDQLAIDRGTNKTIGHIDEAGGLWIQGGANHRISKVEVFGDGKANGIVIWNTRLSIYDRLFVRDMGFDDANAEDDVMQGIWLYGNVDCILRKPRVSNLFGNALYAGVRFPNLRTRGIALAGNLRVHIDHPYIRDVDQGIDLTGSDGNRECVVRGGHSYQCASVGVKLANSAVECRVIGHTAERIGMYAFLASGPSEPGLPYKTQDCEFIDCTALDVGYNEISHPTPAGFEILQGNYDADHPKGIRFIRCRAMDRQTRKTMKYGFYSNVAPNPDKPNKLIDPVSYGHAIEAKFGSWQ
jgi:hypothetical protein